MGKVGKDEKMLVTLKTVWQLLIKLNIRTSYYEQAILLLHIYPREMKHGSKDLYVVYGRLINTQKLKRTK